MAKNEENLKIAVVGGGVAGIVAAYVLSRRHRVTIFEKAGYLGGHTNTIEIGNGPDQGAPVDTGFIVCNKSNYPCFYRFLDQLEVPLRDCDMCFSFHSEETGLTYNGPTFRHFMAEPRNLFQPRFLRMLIEQRRFNRRAAADLKNGTLDDRPLGRYFKDLRLSRFFIENYVIPLAASIWSSPDSRIYDFPAITFIRFFDNHGMLDMSRLPQWQTVAGGSYSYVKAFKSRFPGEIRLNTPAEKIRRSANAVEIDSPATDAEKFDRVVLALHADQALTALSDPAPEETALLGAWKYNSNHTVLHTDTSLLPAKQRLWASWNYLRRRKSAPTDPLSITYYMNRLQGLHTARHYMVTLNRSEQIKAESVIYQIDYTHPIYTSETVRTQERLRALSGRRNTYYCGAYMRYGFHEDGVASALDVAAKLGLEL